MAVLAGRPLAFGCLALVATLLLSFFLSSALSCKPPFPFRCCHIPPGQNVHANNEHHTIYGILIQTAHGCLLVFGMI